MQKYISNPGNIGVFCFADLKEKLKNTFYSQAADFCVYIYGTRYRKPASAKSEYTDGGYAGCQYAMTGQGGKTQ